MSRKALAAPALCAAVIAAVILSGCGQKGPLYLPDSGGEVITRPMSTGAEAMPSGAPDPTAPHGRRPTSTPAPTPTPGAAPATRTP